MTQYFDLRIRCPVEIDRGGSGGVPRQWYHRNCPAGAGKLQVGDNAHYRCLSCGAENHARNWRYLCEETDRVNAQAASSAAVAQAISTAGQLVTRAGRMWLLNFVTNLGD